MYSIAVCDDVKESLDEIVALTRSIMNELNIEYSLKEFETQRALSAQVAAGDRFHLFILEILLADGNGVEMVRALRRQEVKGSVIFASTCADYVMEGYDVQAIKYLLKPVDRGQLMEAIRYDYECRFKGRRLCYGKHGEIFAVRQSDIVYLEYCRRQVYFHLRDGRCENVRGKLVDLEKDLSPTQFVRSHVSFCVNLDYVEKSSSSHVKLSTGESLPVGRTYSKRFRDQMLQYFL